MKSNMRLTVEFGGDLSKGLGTRAVFDQLPIPVAGSSKAWVCDRSLAGNAGSNPAVGMDVCLL